MPITAVTAEPIVGQVVPELAIISSLGEHRRGHYVLVRVHDEVGRVGLGEASVTSVWSGETQGGTIALIREVLAPLVVGADPFDTEWIRLRLDRAAFGNSFAKAALEMALLDLQGQTLGVPVYRLLGGRRPEALEAPAPPLEAARPKPGGLRLKFVVGAVEPALAAQRAATMVQRGWQAIKVKVGRHHHPQADVDRLRAVRDAIGPDVWLSVDANGGYTVEQAVWAAARFEKLNVALFEQPTRRGDHAAMAQVRHRCGLPIMADESVFTPLDALEVIRHQAADVLSLYPGKHGGMRTTQAIAQLAEAAGLACTIGSNLEREVATAAMAHVATATANIQCERFPGDLIGPLYYDQPLTREPLRYQVDRLEVPEAPGLGVRL
ncbi:MAG: mandelate racemase/muconate lactonizing protein [Gemmataceae bacterium]|nr:mandelate racemase/muconate lactonizing protein [Gemmataceae bacterium]MDW8265488.1 enolase C-terminal domain-like protein [Gemmataceae bacterium]